MADEVKTRPNHGVSYNDLRKAEELRKMPVLTDAPDFADDAVESPHGHKGHTEHKTTQVGPNLYHHYSKEAGHGSWHEPGTTFHFHSLSESPDHNAKPIAVLHGRTSGTANNFKVDSSLVDAERRSEGHGTHIYKLAAKHHGSLESDTTLSSDAHDVYKRIKKDPKYKVKLGTTGSDTEDEDENSHHVKYVGKSEPQPGDSYNDLRKAEELRKMPSIYDGGDNVHPTGTPSRSKSEYKRQGWKDPKKTVLANGLHHYVYEADHEYTDPKEYRHTLRTPAGKELAGMKVESYPGESPTIEHVAVHPDHKGKGYGKQLYNAALMHHGDLRSGATVSDSAHKHWKTWDKTKGVHTELAPRGEGSEYESFRHEASNLGMKNNLKTFPKVKKSEGPDDWNKWVENHHRQTNKLEEIRTKRKSSEIRNRKAKASREGKIITPSDRARWDSNTKAQNSPWKPTSLNDQKQAFGATGSKGIRK